MGKKVFYNPATGRPDVDEQKQHQVWTRSLRTCQVRYRPLKECRDTSVTLGLMAGANPIWVALQHAQSVLVMLRHYANWIPSAGKGANLAAVNLAIEGTAQAQKNAV